MGNAQGGEQRHPCLSFNDPDRVGPVLGAFNCKKDEGNDQGWVCKLDPYDPDWFWPMYLYQQKQYFIGHAIVNRPLQPNNWRSKVIHAPFSCYPLVCHFITELWPYHEQATIYSSQRLSDIMLCVLSISNTLSSRYIFRRNLAVRNIHSDLPAKNSIRGKMHIHQACPPRKSLNPTVHQINRDLYRQSSISSVGTQKVRPRRVRRATYVYW